jgi:hypothetical protein
MLDKQKEKTGLASLQQMHRNTVITSRPHTHSAHFAGILALPPIPHAGNRKIKQPASLPGLGRLCAAMLMVLGGQQAIPGARHRPEPTGLHHARLGEKGSCEWAQRAGSEQGTGPSGLHGSAAMTRCFSHQPEALTCHPRRARPARLVAEGVSDTLNSRRWPAVMTPRNGGLRADDAVASHSAVDGGGPSIDAARTYAGGISRGAVAAVTCVWPANGA